MAHDLRHAAKAIARNHRQRAFQHQEQARRPISRREQLLTAAVLPTFAEPFDARDVSLGEGGKGLIAAPPMALSYGFTWICLSSCMRPICKPDGSAAILMRTARIGLLKNRALVV
jgi:hypothetical protein